MAILAADLDRIGDLAVDQAVAMAVLGKMAVGALHADFGVNAHHMNGFAGIDARFNKLAFVTLAEFLRIITGDDIFGVRAVGGLIALGIEQIAIAVAFQDRPEIPAVAVIVSELGILGVAVEIIDIAQEIDVSPQPLRCGSFGIPVEHGADFCGGRIFLLLVFLLIFLVAHAFRPRRLVVGTRPHIRGVRFIVPHGVAEIAVQEDIRLVHVAVHALGGGNRAGECMLDRMPFFAFRGLRLAGTVIPMVCALAMSLCGWFRGYAMRALGAMRGVVGTEAAEPMFSLFQVADGRVDGLGLAVAAIFRPDRTVPRFAVIGVDDMAASAAGLAIVAGLVIGAHEPHERIVEPGLVDVENRNGDAQAGAGAAIGLFEVGTAGLFQSLDDAADIWQADFRELGIDIAATALEDAENIAWRNRVPGRQGIENGQGTALLLGIGDRAMRIAR